jgi:integrin alpha FG-GAP repeat containing protein 1
MDTRGHLRIVQTCQLAQQSYHSLLTATNIIGLGRTNNYIEDLFVGVTRHSQHVASYQGIIPNSAVVVSPHQEPGPNPESWRLELFMNPSSTTTAILIVLGVTLAILAIIILCLDTMERREDEIEKRKLLHNINFDAL